MNVKPYKSPEQRPQVFETRLHKALHQLLYFKNKTDREVRSCLNYDECCMQSGYYLEDSCTEHYESNLVECECRSQAYLERMDNEDT